MLPGITHEGVIRLSCIYTSLINAFTTPKVDTSGAKSVFIWGTSRTGASVQRCGKAPGWRNLNESLNGARNLSKSSQGRGSTGLSAHEPCAIRPCGAPGRKRRQSMARSKSVDLHEARASVAMTAEKIVADGNQLIGTDRPDTLPGTNAQSAQSRSEALKARADLPQLVPPYSVPFRRTIRRSELRQIVPLADTTIYEMERRGEFPRRFFLTSRCVVWNLAEVEAWVEARRQAANAALLKRAPTPDVRRRKRRPVKAAPA